MSDNQLIVTGVGSYDWAGYKAPAGGVHTGTSLVTMVDGATYAVAHSVTEVRQKQDVHAGPPTVPAWVAFDVPQGVVPVILDVTRIRSVT